jgi:predicted anti-sigma-YlaC factor YlaD
MDVDVGIGVTTGVGVGVGVTTGVGVGIGPTALNAVVEALAWQPVIDRTVTETG